MMQTIPIPLGILVLLIALVCLESALFFLTIGEGKYGSGKRSKRDNQ